MGSVVWEGNIKWEEWAEVVPPAEEAQLPWGMGKELGCLAGANVSIHCVLILPSPFPHL